MIAGTVPKITPAAIDSTTLNTRIEASISTFAARGRSDGATLISARTPQDASNSPAAPPPEREQQSPRAARDRQDDALGEQLANQTPPSCPERRADGDLTGPRA